MRRLPVGAKPAKTEATAKPAAPAMNVGVVGNPNYPDLGAFLATLRQKASHAGLKLYTEERIQALWPTGDGGAPPALSEAPGALDCLITLGGEHSITAPVVAALAARHPGLSVLQIDAHADLRDCYMGTPHNHACAMRRVLDYARATQVGIRSLSSEEAAAAPTLPTTIFYDYNMRQHKDWIQQVVDSLGETVYITIDCDGFDPAIMPAVGTPEPGGLSWYEGLALLRRVIESRRVVGCDIVELCPLPGIVAPNFLCAKLIYKILTYRFGREVGNGSR